MKGKGKVSFKNLSMSSGELAADSGTNVSLAPDPNGKQPDDLSHSPPLTFSADFILRTPAQLLRPCLSVSESLRHNPPLLPLPPSFLFQRKEVLLFLSKGWLVHLAAKSYFPLLGPGYYFSHHPFFLGS
uniref:Uncharacterized protein n=1 Tax=Pipistrellus kuhlii TaxID=59472 RepID=A0A7J7W3R6_PIPKU|nr:hypothetical protein mPipKuh1_008137 [Pipistrellus kuhlii]